jgi:hypothetical protein
MTDLEIDDLAREWIAYQEASEGAGQNCREVSELQWVYNLVDEMIREQPEETWKFVLAVRRLDRSEMIERDLACQVFEDVMSAHGATLIERVEAEAKRDPSFVRLIELSYRLEMTDDVWSRLQLLANQ